MSNSENQKNLEQIYNTNIDNFAKSFESLFSKKTLLACFEERKSPIVFGGINNDVSRCQNQDNVIVASRDLIKSAKDSAQEMEDTFKKDKSTFTKTFTNDNDVSEVTFKLGSNDLTARYGYFERTRNNVQEKCIGTSVYVGDGEVGGKIKLCILGDTAVTLDNVESAGLFSTAKQANLFFAPVSKTPISKAE